ncbi:hypothetical protein AGMMS49938_06100 [Fibrobacterales bacterium]|nr:hypothetical protein AGMMS49938_06100 [Fibrobacterales bacterium]
MVLDSTWSGLKKRNIDNCQYEGLICRPKSETPGDAVSEGVGYGMLLALYSDDQTYFDKIYTASKKYYLNACNGWRKPANGGNTESGSASDADEDIGAALIFADKLQKKGIWETSSINYATEAQGVLDCIHNYIRPDGGFPPGNSWDPGYNVGYFSPAWYRIFKKFDSNSGHDWQKVIDKSYSVIEATSSYDIGMVPDWSGHDGAMGGGGYNTYLSGKAFFKDAIRVLWRIANDAIWFDEPRAKTFLQNSVKFINEKGGASASNFYQLEGANKGELVPASDKWTDFNGSSNTETWRFRREHSHLTIGQWACAAMAVGDSADKVGFSAEIAKFYDWKNKVDFFGVANDPNPATLEDTLHNEMYFDQFLAWFGVSLMSGTWVNVLDALDNPVENTVGITVEPFPEEVPIFASAKQTTANFSFTQRKTVIEFNSQNANTMWEVRDLKGKLIFSATGKTAVWNSNFNGVVLLNASDGSQKFSQLLTIF